VISRRAFIALSGSALVSCSRGTSALPVGAVDLVQVTVDLRRVDMLNPVTPDEAPTSPYCGGKPKFCSSTHVRDIHDPAAIKSLADFVNARLDGWYEPMTGLPISTINVKFWREQKAVATFGAGTNFFSRGGFPSQKIIGAKANELTKFYKLAHLDIAPKSPTAR
jgi:hypothetical protein